MNFQELARCTEDFNGAQLKAVRVKAVVALRLERPWLTMVCVCQVCVEAGMIALRREASTIQHEDFMEGISQVQLKKKQSLQYYA